MADDVVGYLEVRLTGEDTYATQDLIDIHGNEQFYVGRNPTLCERHWSDATISNKHLRIHCILYDKNGNGEVPPLVYATDVSSNGTYLKKNNAACVDAQSGRAVLMTRKQGAFLLDDQDELRISDTVTLIYHTLEPTSESSLTETQKSEVQQFASEYLLTGRLLGKGGFGKVVVGIHQNSIRQVACKIVNLKTLSPRDPMPTLLLSDRGQDSGLSNTPGLGKRWSSKVTRCSREFMILKELSHPNVINVEKVFWSSDTIYMFQELITGGDLFSYMERKGDTLTSLEAATIILQLLKAVDYLHDRNIVHRDLKPDNILLAYPEDGTRIVVTDFGNARVVPSRTGSRNGRMFTNAGTVEYIAPEIYEKNSTLSKGSGYSKAVDMWSIGVIASNLLSHEALFAAPPHEADPHAYVLKLAARCDISIMDDGAHPAWSKVGDKPKDFIRQLLVLQEDDRMSVKQALAHPWFTNPYLAQEFEALYARSIRDWQPRCKVSKLIEPLELGSSKKRVADQTTAACVQEASNCVSCDIQDVSSASQDWDLSIVYPPLGDDSILPDQERAEYERPNRDDHRSIELGVRAAYNDSQNSVDTSMVRISLGHDPPASGMYEQDHHSSTDMQGLAQQRHLAYDSFNTPAAFNAPSQKSVHVDMSSMSYPPRTQASSLNNVNKRVPSTCSNSSIVYETPLRDSQLQGAACYSNTSKDVEHAQEQASASHACK